MRHPGITAADASIGFIISRMPRHLSNGATATPICAAAIFAAIAALLGDVVLATDMRTGFAHHQK